jgi:hypothetical protein
MADEPIKPDAPPVTGADETEDPAGDDPARERFPGSERFPPGISDFVRRAVSAGLGAASRGKEDFVRVAATEVRSWLDHLDLDAEIAKALARMVIEVKTEIRFRATEDGKLVPEATHDATVKPAPKG